jgi:hypothetical protein
MAWCVPCIRCDASCGESDHLQRVSASALGARGEGTYDDRVDGFVESKDAVLIIGLSRRLRVVAEREADGNQQHSRSCIQWDAPESM